MKKILLLIFCFQIYGEVDFVIFSFDRPMQLYALLESTEKYITGLGETSIIYRVSNNKYMEAYRELINRFSWAKFIHQSKIDASRNFKRFTLKAAFSTPSQYVMFGVDDIIVKDYCDLNRCVNELNKTDAYGFYLRLGLNITQGYPASLRQKIPPYSLLEEDIMSWVFAQGECNCNWAYPNTVDMTIFRKNDIEEDFRQMFFKAPNNMEAAWHQRIHKIMHRKGLCFTTSKIVNIPLNRVQKVFNNPHMNFMSAEKLLVLFARGKKIDISLLHQLNNLGCHFDYIPTFIDR